ncbi:MAG: phage tail sheath subtilisin-like domain-containing protein [Acidobacteriota bacterium]|nr:phage tail sheath subtilisin-like domain-containing protein [Acidobacteriota bacterium]
MTAKPGIAIAEQVRLPPEAVVPSLGILGLVGMAERGPVNRPVRLTSSGAFLAVFGDLVGHSYLAPAVHAFFLNGGQACRVVRVVHPQDRPASLDLGVLTGGLLPLRLTARSPGEWGNAIEVTVWGMSDRKIELGRLQSGEPLRSALIRLRDGHSDPVYVFDQAMPVCKRLDEDQAAAEARFNEDARIFARGFKLEVRHGNRLETFDQLSMDPRHERFVCKVIDGNGFYTDPQDRKREGLSTLVTAELIGDAPDYEPRRDIWRGCLAGGAEMRAPLPKAEAYTGYRGPHGRPLFDNLGKRPPKGLACLEDVAEVETIAIPDLVLAGSPARRQADTRSGPIWQKEPGRRENHTQYEEGLRHLIIHAERAAPRFAILDPPRPTGMDRGIRTLTNLVRNFHLYSGARNGAVYHPWLRLPYPGKGDLWVPPSGHVAGIYSRTVHERGLGAAPANYFLSGATALQVGLTHGEQGLLNSKGVNCLDCVPGKGVRVWGARTLWYGNTPKDVRWTYVSVRLLYLRLERFIRDTLMEAVFEPNDPDLWDEIAATLSLFMNELFLAGDLAGTTESEAYFVKCDEETNPPESVDQGRVIALLGFAPVLPAEFILVTITRHEDGVLFNTDSILNPTEV